MTILFHEPGDPLPRAEFGRRRRKKHAPPLRPPAWKLVAYQRKYLDAMLRIEAESFACPWSSGYFAACLGRRGRALGKVLFDGRSVAGFVIYEQLPHRLSAAAGRRHRLGVGVDLLSLAVAEDCRRRGFGRMMIEHLRAVKIHRLDQLKPRRWSWHRARWIEAYLHESNLGGHLFLNACGFRALGVHREHLAEHDFEGDCYRFAWRKEL